VHRVHHKIQKNSHASAQKICMWMYSCMANLQHMCRHMHVQNVSARMYIYMHVHIYICMCTHPYHIHMHIHSHMTMYSHMYMYITCTNIYTFNIIHLPSHLHSRPPISGAPCALPCHARRPGPYHVLCTTRSTRNARFRPIYTHTHAYKHVTCIIYPPRLSPPSSTLFVLVT